MAMNRTLRGGVYARAGAVGPGVIATPPVGLHSSQILGRDFSQWGPTLS